MSKKLEAKKGKEEHVTKNHIVMWVVLHKNRRHRGKLMEKAREPYCSHAPTSFLICYGMPIHPLPMTNLCLSCCVHPIPYVAKHARRSIFSLRSPFSPLLVIHSHGHLYDNSIIGMKISKKMVCD